MTRQNHDQTCVEKLLWTEILEHQILKLTFWKTCFSTSSCFPEENASKFINCQSGVNVGTSFRDGKSFRDEKMETRWNSFSRPHIEIQLVWQAVIYIYNSLLACLYIRDYFPTNKTIGDGGITLDFWIIISFRSSNTWDH